MRLTTAGLTWWVSPRYTHPTNLICPPRMTRGDWPLSCYNLSWRKEKGMGVRFAPTGYVEQALIGAVCDKLEDGTFVWLVGFLTGKNQWGSVIW